MCGRSKRRPGRRCNNSPELKRLTRLGVVDGPITMAGLSKELVTNAMYCDDMMRFRWVLLDLLTKTSNVVVYRTRERKVVVAAYLVKQLSLTLTRCRACDSAILLLLIFQLHLGDQLPDLLHKLLHLP